jgi:hypothetical protein
MSLPNDTLVCDTTRLAYWQNNPAYDYNRELVAPDYNLIDWFGHLLNKLLRNIFGNEFAEKYSDVFFIAVFIIVIALVVWFIYKKKPELFMRNKKNATPYTVHEDNIYGIDFDKEIKKALYAKDYKNAIRFLYLQTLKHVSDNNLINWQLYKTPTEYIYEIQSEALRPLFRDLTNRFLCIRYGNYEADEQSFNKMLSLRDNIRKGGEA